MASNESEGLADVSVDTNMDSDQQRRAAKDIDIQLDDRIIALKRTRSGHIAYMTRQYKAIETALLSFENKDAVLKLAMEITEQWHKFNSSHRECMLQLTDQRDIDDMNESYEKHLTGYNELQERLGEWHSKRDEAERDKAEVLKEQNVDSVSMTSSRRKEAMLKRKMAELKLKQLKERQAIERQKRELEDRMSQQEAQAELEQAELEESILDDSSHSDVTEIHIKGMNNGDAEVRVDIQPKDIATPQYRLDQTAARNMPMNGHSSRTLDPNATPWTNDRNNSSSADAFQAMASAIQESFNLPKPQLLTFNGNPTDYCKFICNFDTNIESRLSDCRLKLSYLIQYCEGEAKRSIEDCVVLPPENGYARARSILQARYGKPHLVARSHVDKLVNGPGIKPNNVQDLMNLSLDMEKCEITLSQLGFVSDINNTENLRKIVKRLPMYLRSRWVVFASSLIEMGREPAFSDLLKFIQDRATEANTMYGQDLAIEPKRVNQTKPARNRSNGSRGQQVTTMATHANDGKGEAQKRVLSCVHCKGKHKLIDCDVFKTLDYEVKKGIVSKFKMCENCLNFKHLAKECKKPNGCDVQGCGRKHHALLHKDSERVHVESDASGRCAATNAHMSERKVSLRIVPVIVKNGQVQVKTYALLDDGSDVTLCSEELVRKLGIKGISRQFTITTVNQSKESRNGVEISVQVGSLDGIENVNLERVWSVAALPISVQSLPDQTELGRWKHLADVILPKIDAKDVGLLIGSDNPEVFWVQDERRGNRGEPYAVKSLLGWTVLGPISKGTFKKKGNVHFQQLNLEQQIERLWTTDFPDVVADNKVGMSQEDRLAMKTMENTLTKEGKHYKLGLPWHSEDVRLPNNRPVAEARLKHLKRKLQSDVMLFEKYRDTLKDYIEKGYAREIDAYEDSKEGRIWYLPHHPVTNPHKPGKVRVVFDCAATYRGTSLNDQLLQGPDLMNSIVGVLLRFRQEQVALVADIEAMFHQVKVRDEDCSVLRFLWWPGGDLEQEPREYCMTVHLFGATSSPSCAAFALKRTAEDNAEDFSDTAVHSVQRNLYVDDLLKSVKDASEGIKLSAELRDILSRGGFRLTKWLSNSKEVMESIPEEEKARPPESISFEKQMHLERTLGVQWNLKDDKFVFDVHLKEQPITRRGILSVASSLYDPLGFVAPVILIPKLILQQICRQGCQWDEMVPEKEARKWKEWLHDLHKLSNVAIERCVKPPDLKTPYQTELHVFSDASEMAYGAAAYVKIYDKEGNSKCSLVLGKSRLAPIKTMSIPRLELSAAVTAVRLYQLLRDEFDIKIDKRYFWTDSTIVLGYVRNKSKRFKTFVANRLAMIHELTTPDDWRYVPTNENPADLASRGIHPSETSKLRTWHSGPAFLQQGCYEWPAEENCTSVSDDDIEVKREATVNAIHETSVVESLFNKYSDWHKLQRAFAWLIRFKAYCRKKFSKAESAPVKDVSQGELTSDEIRQATKCIAQMLQENAYKDEKNLLSNKGQVLKSSSLIKLSPIYEDGLLKVGGRLGSADLPNETKHPIILPSAHHVTKILIRKYHESNGHAGAQHVLSLLRQKYWIPKGLQMVKRVIGNCVTCKRRRQRLVVQQMAPLPSERLTPDEPPFTYTGADYFGPLYVKTGRSQSKRYGCLFTCLTTRAVHVEIAHSLDTDSFLNALIRFISRRGRPKKMFSDNGTNLKSGERELKQSIAQWNQSVLTRNLSQREIEWHFNPPQASHMGGIWERMIRSVKDVMKSIANEQLLNDEALLTLVAEAEKIVNDRPITQISDDHRDPEPLTPNKILLLRPNSCFPLGVFDKNDCFSKRWWRQVQYLANVFWRRWTREYLPILQLRQKWHQRKRNISVKDLVLVCDETLPRGQWPLGLVTEVIQGRDGLVRSCKVRFGGSVKVRPVSKLCLLEDSSI